MPSARSTFSIEDSIGATVLNFSSNRKSVPGGIWSSTGPPPGCAFGCGKPVSVRAMRAKST